MYQDLKYDHPLKIQNLRPPKICNKSKISTYHTLFACKLTPPPPPPPPLQTILNIFICIPRTHTNNPHVQEDLLFVVIYVLMWCSWKSEVGFNSVKQCDIILCVLIMYDGI